MGAEDVCEEPREGASLLVFRIWWMGGALQRGYLRNPETERTHQCGGMYMETEMLPGAERRLQKKAGGNSLLLVSHLIWTSQRGNFNLWLLFQFAMCTLQILSVLRVEARAEMCIPHRKMASWVL